MLFGLGLAAVSFVPGFQMLAQAVNPALVSAAQHVPVTVIAAPADCSVQFDLIGKSKFLSACDVAKNALASLGIPYRNVTAPAGTAARVQIGSATLNSVIASQALTGEECLQTNLPEPKSCSSQR